MRGSISEQAEWTWEGGPKPQEYCSSSIQDGQEVGSDGDPIRYKRGAYVSVRQSGCMASIRVVSQRREYRLLSLQGMKAFLYG